MNEIKASSGGELATIESVRHRCEAEALQEFINARRHGQQKHGGEYPDGHDLGHSREDWLAFIEQHLERAKVGTPEEYCAEIVKIGGLCVTAYWAHRAPSAAGTAGRHAQKQVACYRARSVGR